MDSLRKRWYKGFGILMVCAMLWSCQDEDFQIQRGSGTLDSTSNLTEWLLRTTSYPVSSDGLLDGTHCFSVSLPVFVRIEGRQVVIENEQDLADVKQMPSSLFEGFVFPLTVILPDQSLMEINSQEEWNAAANCTSYRESNDCAHLEYPISLYLYNSDQQVQATRTLVNDEEFYTFLADLPQETYYSLRYPVRVHYSNGVSQNAQSDAELQSLLEDAIHQCAPAPALSCMPFYLRTGLVAQYGFGGGSLEDSQEQFDLQSYGNVAMTTNRANRENQALAFNFVNDSYLFSAPTQNLIQPSHLSISLWYKPSNDLSGYESLVSYGQGWDCAQRFGNWSVGLADNRRPEFSYRSSVMGTTFSQQNVWYHLVATYDGDSGQSKIYLNGQLETTTTVSNGCPWLANGESLSLILGRYYTGALDDVAIYDRTLSAAEVLALKNVAPCR